MKLPCDIVMSVRDLVNSMQPNTPDAYEQLKARLTDSYAKTRWQQVFALIDLPALGDRRPSHLMNEMLASCPPEATKTIHCSWDCFCGNCQQPCRTT
jgi:hypothetical protein